MRLVRPRWLCVQRDLLDAQRPGLGRRMQLVVDFLVTLFLLRVGVIFFDMARLGPTMVKEEVFWLGYSALLICAGLSRYSARLMPLGLFFGLVLFGFVRKILSRPQASALFSVQILRALQINPTVLSIVAPRRFTVTALVLDIVWLVYVSWHIFPDPISYIREVVFSALIYYALLGQALYLLFKAEAEVAERTRALEVARDQALEGSRLKSQFVATMSHEFRTPLNGVLGLTRFLLESELTPVQREWASSAHASGQLLLSLANQILEFARLGSCAAPVADDEIHVQALVDGVLRVGGVCARPGVDMLGHVCAGVPPRVRGDATRLQQVLINLVGNATKFTEQGCVRLTVFAAAVLGSDGEPACAPDPVPTQGDAAATAADDAAPVTLPPRVRLSFVVSDTGPGLPAGLQQRLFRPFVQGEHGRGGAGLGLSIALQLAQSMGGGVDVYSRPGAGAEFCAEVELTVADPNWLRCDPVSPACWPPVRALVLSPSRDVARFCCAVLAEAGVRARAVVAAPATAAAGWTALLAEHAAHLRAEPDNPPRVLLDSAPVAVSALPVLLALAPHARPIVLLRPEESAVLDALLARAPAAAASVVRVYKPVSSARLSAACVALQSGGALTDETAPGRGLPLPWDASFTSTPPPAPPGPQPPSLAAPSVSPTTALPPPVDGESAQPQPADGRAGSTGASSGPARPPLTDAATAPGVSPPDPAGRDAALAAGPPVTTESGVRRLLIAEDAEVNRLVVRVMVQRLGFAADIVADGAQAVDAFRARPPGYYDQCLMDVQMPVMDGLQATRAIRALERERGGPPLRVVALTAGVLQDDRQACFEAGMDGFVSKPLRADELRDALLSAPPPGP